MKHLGAQTEPIALLSQAWTYPSCLAGMHRRCRRKQLLVQSNVPVAGLRTEHGRKHEFYLCFMMRCAYLARDTIVRGDRSGAPRTSLSGRDI
jgi:hypothetical protein